MPDEELLSRFQQKGDSRFLGELYSRYTHLVFGVCMKYFKDEDTAHDAVLQIFEVLLKKLPTAEVSNFKGWLYQVSRNHCLMDLRKQKTAKKHYENYGREAQADMELEQSAHHAEEEVSPEERVEQLKEAVSTLKEEQRRCIELFFFKEKSYQQIADETQLSLKQVKSHLQNGKRNIKKELLKSGLWMLLIGLLP